MQFLRKSTISVIILTVALAAMYCCCFTKTAQAKESTVLCHEDASQTNSPSQAKPCDCQKILSITLNQQTISPQIETSLLDSFNYVFANLVPSISLTHLEYNSNQLALEKTDLPLYLQYSILRI